MARLEVFSRSRTIYGKHKSHAVFWVFVENGAQHFSGCEFDRFWLEFDREDINQCGMFGMVRSGDILSQFMPIYLV